MSESIAAESESRHSARRKPSLVHSRRFALADLTCALIAAALWYVSDGRLGAWPLIIAAVPWMVRIFTGHAPLPRTRLDWLMAIFLVTAALGGWAAYNATIAWDKFWLVIGAAVLYYALAGQRPSTVWHVVYGAAVAAVGVAVYFLLTHDFVELPAKVGFLNSIGLSLMKLRPDFFAALHRLHPNVAGGLIALMLPFVIAAGLRANRHSDPVGLLAATVGTVVAGFGLLMTTSRGAWLAVAGGLLAWGLWAMAEPLARRLYLTRRQALGIEVLALLGLGLTALLIMPGGLMGLLDRLPGPASAGSRMVISRDAVDLAGDFPIIGGGLGAFDGLYSHYIRVIPNHVLIHAHNLYLNVAVEQGLPGLLALLLMIGLAFWWLADPRKSEGRRTLKDRSFVCGALFASLAVLCLHGLVEDALYGSRGLLLLWLPLGLTAAVFPRRHTMAETLAAVPRVVWFVVGMIGLVAVAMVVVNYTRVQSTWHSNIGAIQMARVELADYPRDEWDDGSRVGLLDEAGENLEHALLLNERNRTAWHRLGLIALQERDFTAAVGALATAHALDPNHRGITKAYGYTLVWAGRVEEAVPLLADVPEAATEMGVYTWWWSVQGREDLSKRAQEARDRLMQLSPTA